MTCHLPITAILPLILGLSGCGLPLIGTEYAVREARVALRGNTPDPESTWNKYGWWKRVSDEPPTYIPTRYSPGASRGNSAGTWFVDQRDGKRLFVPKGDDILTADARVITTRNIAVPPVRYEGQTTKENLEAAFPCLSGSCGSPSFYSGSGKISCPSMDCPMGN
jgi:hypothetical protein